MNPIKILFNVLTLVFVCLIPQFAEATPGIKELKSYITSDKPIYQVPDSKFEELLGGLRDYNLIMLVTTSDPKYNCEMCSQFDPIFEKIVQNIYKKSSSYKNKIIFARVEASIHLESLKSLGISSIPQIWGFPESQRVLGENYEKIVNLLKLKDIANSKGEVFENPDWYDLNKVGLEHYVFQLSQGDQWEAVINKLADFLGMTTNIDLIPAIRPETSTNSFNLISVVKILSLGIILYKVLERIRAKDKEGEFFLTNKRLYAYLSIVLILLNLSGFNFTTQRASPFVSQSEGQILWVAPSSGVQFGAEVIISIAIQACFILVLFVLFNYVDSFSPTVKHLVVSLCGLSLMGLLLLGADIYHLKSPAYPFNYGHLF